MSAPLVAVGLLAKALGAVPGAPPPPAATAPQAVGAAPAADPTDGPLRTARLANGLQIVVEARRHVPEVVVLVRHPTGSRDEPRGQHGTTHLLEHLLFEGSTHAPDRGLERTVQGLGGWSNAWTGPDDLIVVSVVPSGALERALFLESDRMGWLAPLAPVDVANQQDVVLRERAEWEGAPRGAQADVLSRALWPPDHPYHHPVFGTVADVRAADPASLHDLHRTRMGPEGAVLAIVGDVDPDAALAAARRWFGAVPDRVRPSPRAGRTVSELAPPDQRRVSHTTTGGQWSLTWSWRGPPSDHPDAVVMAVLPALISDGQGTPLADAAFALGGLGDSTASWWSGTEGGQLDLTVGVGRARLPEAAQAIAAVVQELQDEGPSEAALHRAAQVSTHGALDLLEDPVERASWRAWCVASSRTPRCETVHTDAIQSVRPADVQRVARTWLSLDRGVQLSLVPEGRSGALPGSVAVELP